DALRVESVGTVASPNLPARKGILALRHAHDTVSRAIVGGSGLSSDVDVVAVGEHPPAREAETKASIVTIELEGES
ncbi:hypothetical protein, partial [Nocardioides caldifontis]|uniref:hypothetical protein n=1 Tax=Nocardioides caldifontis TaxID=2588938 RepID=UPI00193A1773